MQPAGDQQALDHADMAGADFRPAEQPVLRKKGVIRIQARGQVGFSGLFCRIHSLPVHAESGRLAIRGFLAIEILDAHGQHAL